MAAQYDAAAKDRNMEFESVSLLLHLCFCTVLVPIWMCACMQSFALAVYHIKCTVTACPPGFPQTLVTALYGNPSYLHYTFTHCGNWLPYGCCHDMLPCFLQIWVSCITHSHTVSSGCCHDILSCRLQIWVLCRDGRRSSQLPRAQSAATRVSPADQTVVTFNFE